MKIYAIFDNSFFANKPKWMLKKLHKAISNRANPRSKTYMIDLLYEKFPNAELIDKHHIPTKTKQIILLYPDAIGLGWSNLENKCLKKFKNVTVLNGRRRSFNLTTTEKNKLLFKRFLEITFLFEILCTPLLLIIGTSLAIKDTIMNRSNDKI